MTSEYEIVKQNGLDYVEVRCPKCKAVLRGQKVSDMKISERIACPVCEQEWSATIPATNGLEAVASC
jgi:transposase-like protein